MKRPLDERSYDPNEKDMKNILMRRFDLSEEEYKKVLAGESPIPLKDYMNIYETTKD